MKRQTSDVEQVLGAEGDALLTGGFLDEEVGAEDAVIEAQGEGDVYAQLPAEVKIADDLGGLAAGASLVGRDAAAAGAFACSVHRVGSFWSVVSSQ